MARRDVQQSSSGGRLRPRLAAAWVAGLALAVAGAEAVGHRLVVGAVPRERDWVAAAAFVDERWEPTDLVVGAPEWTDPLVRHYAGEHLGLEDVGRSDLAAYGRLWSIGIGDARPADAPIGPPALRQAFERVVVQRWDLPSPSVVYDFSAHVADAEVVLVDGDEERPCRFQARGRPSGGGLGAGPIQPGARHLCDPRRPWLWVGATVQDTLNLEPRYCIWQHPPGGPDPVRSTFRSVPLEGVLVFGGDVYYEHERHEEHGPVVITVKIDGQTVLRQVHRDGDGWQQVQIPTATGRRAVVEVEVRAPDPTLRTYCWAATTRRPR